MHTDLHRMHRKRIRIVIQCNRMNFHRKRRDFVFYVPICKTNYVVIYDLNKKIFYKVFININKPLLYFKNTIFKIAPTIMLSTYCKFILSYLGM